MDSYDKFKPSGELICHNTLGTRVLYQERRSYSSYSTFEPCSYGEIIWKCSGHHIWFGDDDLADIISLISQILTQVYGDNPGTLGKSNCYSIYSIVCDVIVKCIIKCIVKRNARHDWSYQWLLRWPWCSSGCTALQPDGCTHQEMRTRPSPMPHPAWRAEPTSCAVQATNPNQLLRATSPAPTSPTTRTAPWSDLTCRHMLTTGLTSKWHPKFSYSPSSCRYHSCWVWSVILSSQNNWCM